MQDGRPQGLYVVFTNGPGPGAEALLRSIESEDSSSALKPAVIRRDVALAEVAEGACEFVELENAQGMGVGPNRSGADWQEWKDGLKALGPFGPAPQHVGDALEDVFDSVFEEHLGGLPGEDAKRVAMREHLREDLITRLAERAVVV